MKKTPICLRIGKVSRTQQHKDVTNKTTGRPRPKPVTFRTTQIRSRRSKQLSHELAQRAISTPKLLKAETLCFVR